MMNGPRFPEHVGGSNMPRYSRVQSPMGTEIVYNGEPPKSPFKMSTKELADEIGSWPGFPKAKGWQKPTRNLSDIKANNQRLAIFHASEDMIDAIKLLLKEGKTETAVRNAEYVLSQAMPPHLYK